MLSLLGINPSRRNDHTCMDPKPHVHEGPFPGVDDHIVTPETREEMVRGELILSQGSEPPRADCLARLG
jgi:hypothetical protein